MDRRGLGGSPFASRISRRLSRMGLQLTALAFDVTVDGHVPALGEISVRAAATWWWDDAGGLSAGDFENAIAGAGEGRDTERQEPPDRRTSGR